MMPIQNQVPVTSLTTENVAAALAATSGADDWQVELLHDDEAQLYLIGNQVESQRAVTNERALVTVYNDHAPAHALAEGSGLSRGFTTLTLLTSDLAEGRLTARLGDAVTMARLTDNPPFGLADASFGGYPEVETWIRNWLVIPKRRFRMRWPGCAAPSPTGGTYV